MSKISMLNDFKSKAAAVGLGALVAFGSVSSPQPADAQSAQMQPASVTRISYSSNAAVDAGRWSLRNPTGAAVAVYLGTSHDLSPALIEQSVRRGFAKNNVGNVVFFYEQNDMPRTGFSLHENGNGYGPYLATELKNAISVVAGQVNLVREHPELASR